MHISRMAGRVRYDSAHRMNPSAEWQLSVGGRSVAIVVAESPANGKLFIRANGRIVGPPLSPAERERLFAFEGRRYRVHRDAAGTLQLDELDPPLVAPPREVRPVVLPPVKPWRRPLLSDEPYTYVVAASVIAIGVINGLIATYMLETRTWARLADLHATIAGAGPDITLLHSQLAAAIRGGLVAQAMIACVITAFGVLLVLRAAPHARLVIQCAAWAMLGQAIETCAISDRLLHQMFFTVAKPAEATRLIAPLHATGWVVILLTAVVSGILLHQVRKIDDVTLASVLAG